jgi:preprotein translocase subunit SecY
VSYRRRLVAFITAIPLIVVGSRITLPGVSVEGLAKFVGDSRGGLLGLYELVFQGGLHRGAVLSLGIMPYLSARVYLWLWRRVRHGPKASRTTTRALTIVLSVIQSLGIAALFQGMPGVVANPGPGFIATTVLTLTAGSLVAMWLGEQFTQSDEPDYLDPIDDDPALRGEIASGNFAHAPETSATRPQPDGVRR